MRAYRSDADVDLLALCPSSCTHEDFFTTLVEMMKREPAIGEIHPISSAYTPVIKFTIHNIHFDMLFGRVSGKSNVDKLVDFRRSSSSPPADDSETAKNTIHNREATTTAEMPNEFFIEESFLMDMENDSEVRGANGVRVTQFIIDFVPNLEKFRVVLCAVKEWATLHGIYSNVLGFLGGVNWAIMVAYVCKRYPDQMPSNLLSTFFKTFATWTWPYPVLLEDDKGGNLSTGTRSVIGGTAPWCPETNHRDARDMMPIITPVYPRSKLVLNRYGCYLWFCFFLVGDSFRCPRHPSIPQSHICFALLFNACFATVLFSFPQ